MADLSISAASPWPHSRRGLAVPPEPVCWCGSGARRHLAQKRGGLQCGRSINTLFPGPAPSIGSSSKQIGLYFAYAGRFVFGSGLAIVTLPLAASSKSTAG